MLFRSNGDRTGLAAEIISLLSNDQERERLGKLAAEGAEKFDWSQVGPQVMNVYLHAIGDGERITVGSEQRGISRILRGEDRE